MDHFRRSSDLWSARPWRLFFLVLLLLIFAYAFVAWNDQRVQRVVAEEMLRRCPPPTNANEIVVMSLEVGGSGNQIVCHAVRGRRLIKRRT